MTSNQQLFDFAAYPTLSTERLILREPVPSDAAEVFAFRSDAYVQRYNAEPLVDVWQALALINELRAGYVTEQRIVWAITLCDEDKVLGLIGYNYWNRYHRRASIGYDLDRAHWGQGIATEAIDAMLRFDLTKRNIRSMLYTKGVEPRCPSTATRPRPWPAFPSG